MKRFVGERVIVVASWSTLRGMRGEVVKVDPVTMVRLDGDDPRPVSVGEREVIAEARERHVGGAE